jgi:hypothetical protein
MTSTVVGSRVKTRLPCPVAVVMTCSSRHCAQPGAERGRGDLLAEPGVAVGADEFDDLDAHPGAAGVPGDVLAMAG